MTVYYFCTNFNTFILLHPVRNRISLQTMTLQPRCENVESSEGVPVTVTCIAQCKISNERDYLVVACEQFLGKTTEYISSVLLQTLEGHLRAILGTMTVEEIYREREQFASLIREIAEPDMIKMGLEILSFTIKDVYDDVNYLSSLGKGQIADVKRDAQIGVAMAERDAGIHEAVCNKDATDVKLSAGVKIEDSIRDYLTQVNEFSAEVNKEQARAQLAYELQASKYRQAIAMEVKEIDLIERKRLTDVQDQENFRKELELKAMINIVADAQAHCIDEDARAKRAEKLALAEAEATRMLKIGEAEAEALKIIGNADAERMTSYAAALKNYDQHAILALTLEALPRIAGEIVAPLAKTKEIVILSGEMGDMANLSAQIPPTINALTGLEFTKVGF